MEGIGPKLRLIAIPNIPIPKNKRNVCLISQSAYLKILNLLGELFCSAI